MESERTKEGDYGDDLSTMIMTFYVKDTFSFQCNDRLVVTLPDKDAFIWDTSKYSYTETII